uniref:Phospholipid phosphatase related 2a n=1 Tax=Gasterosteus aculeatus aculeatus TaxID=481459 RepID=A0AAQ4S6E4_GASAC
GSNDNVQYQGINPRKMFIMFISYILVIMAGTVLLAYYFEYTDTFPVHVQGFFCYDKTFSKPYPGPDDASKIPPVLIYSLVTAIPTLTVRVRVLKCARGGMSGGGGRSSEEEVVGIGVFAFVPSLTSALPVTDACCQRPHILRRNVSGQFSICAAPHRTATSTENSHFHARLHGLGSMLFCLRLALSAASALQSSLHVGDLVHAVSMYVTLVFKTKGTRLTKPTISLTLLCLAMLVGVVRVAEYRNHWADVLAGFFTGGAIAVFLVTCVINNFQQILPNLPPPRPQRPESVLGMPMVTLPCVESPLEKLSGPQVRGGGG